MVWLHLPWTCRYSVFPGWQEAACSLGSTKRAFAGTLGPARGKGGAYAASATLADGGKSSSSMSSKLGTKDIGTEQMYARCQCPCWRGSSCAGLSVLFSLKW